MWCASLSTRHRPTALQMHTVVESPLTSVSEGRITCRPVGASPVTLQWYGPDGREVATDSSRCQALGVLPGKYRVIATDDAGERADLTLDVEAMYSSALVVQEYRVTHATTGTSRDGSVEALGPGLSAHGRFLWTHGVQTDGPTLRDVPCGVYCVMPLGDGGAEVPTLVHLCPPARVEVAPRG